MAAIRRIALPFLLGALLLGCAETGSVKVGAVLPLSGEGEIYGQAVRKGLELALEQLQAREDYPYEVTLEIVDTQSDPERATDLAKQQYDSGAIAVIGGVITVEALAIVPISDSYNRILLSPSASSPELTGISKYFYRVFPSDDREGTMMGNFATSKLELESVVILAKEDPYAKGVVDVFSPIFEHAGGTVTEILEYPRGAGDFSGFLDRVMTLDPKGVYVAAYAEDVGRMITGLRKRGFRGTILTTSAFAAPEVIEQVGEPAEGVFLTQAVFEVESEDPRIAAFVSAFRQKYGLSPDLYAAHGYDALMVLADALLELDDGPVATDVWKGMRKLKEVAGVTGTIQFDERGDVQKFPRVYVIQGGNLVDYEKEVERRRRELLERLRALEEAQRRRNGGG